MIVKIMDTKGDQWEMIDNIERIAKFQIPLTSEDGKKSVGPPVKELYEGCGFYMELACTLKDGRIINLAIPRDRKMYLLNDQGKTIEVLN